jgi:hypothetical protein
MINVNNTLNTKIAFNLKTGDQTFSNQYLNDVYFVAIAQNLTSMAP